MSDYHQFFTINYGEYIDYIRNAKAEEVTERIVRAICSDLLWPEEMIKNTTIRETCVKIFDNHEYHCEDNGYVYYGLMLLCEHRRIPADGWKSQYTDEVAEYVSGTSVSQKIKDIFWGLVKGRDPFYNVMDIGWQNAVTCFIKEDEPKTLIKEIEACSDFDEGNISNMDVEEIIFNEFIPAIDEQLPPGHCIAVFTM